MSGHDYAVVGAGIVGLAVARELGRRYPGCSVVVLEKEEAPARHQSGRNSGVVHAGLYYQPGTLKAELCRRGRLLLRDFCAEAGVDLLECGKLVIASTPAEVADLRRIEARARANGVPNLAWVPAGAIADIEPHAAGVAALHSPRTAVVDFAAVASALARDCELRLGFEVAAVREAPGGVHIESTAGDTVRADRAVLCGGLHADRLAAMAGGRPDVVVVPFRGEYWRLRPERSHLVRGLIYPVPDPRYPFLGVHFTRRVDGSVDLGPNAVMALAREGYRRRDFDGRFALRLAASPALWRLAGTHWKAGLHELAGSVSKRVFVGRAQELVPAVTAADVVPAPTGVRAQAVDRRGRLVDDFRVSAIGDGRVTAVLNAPSPAATSSLAIAAHVVEQLARR